MRPASQIWPWLTTPSLMKQWMLDENDDLEVITNWNKDSPIIIKGKLNHHYFENKGHILIYEKNVQLKYDHLSSLSHLPDVKQNYCAIHLLLSPENTATQLQVTISNFPTYEIYKHLEFYWSITIVTLKQIIENSPQ